MQGRNIKLNTGFPLRKWHSRRRKVFPPADWTEIWGRSWWNDTLQAYIFMVLEKDGEDHLNILVWQMRKYYIDRRRKFTSDWRRKCTFDWRRKCTSDWRRKHTSDWRRKRTSDIQKTRGGLIGLATSCVETAL